MRLTVLSVLFSYVLVNLFYEGLEYLRQLALLNAIEMFKIFLQILFGAIIQFFVSKGYLKWQDRKKNEKVFDKFTKQEEINSTFWREIDQLKSEIKEQRNSLYVIEGRLEMLLEFVHSLVAKLLDTVKELFNKK